MAESLPKDGFDLVFCFDIESTEYKNNTAFDKTNKDGGYKGSAKMIVGGVCTKKYVIHGTPINLRLSNVFD